ncbi:methyltransferase domain-containing protein [Sediminitomix flava]|uniref:Thiopurine S-methyltransferase n=1 Tax=Sediminitomix flava TaxID=379075 RepID=A0A315ZFL5_SEDFL|nr:methyltransferase domain-containing protein [Sediminitomix flava]PWJ43949.1 thiopurine S-methyltransferase [Sediminitomix flava]
MPKESLDKDYWENKYKNLDTGWDAKAITTPLKTYFDQLEDKNLKILIPGAGNSYEAQYLHEQGFKNVYVVDIAQQPLDNLLQRCPSFPKKHMIKSDFFELKESNFDLIIEQTFFCALDPLLRKRYIVKLNNLLKEKGKVVGLLFDLPLNTDHPPFGGDKTEYLTLFNPLFQIKVFEKCYNSIPPRQDNEFFFIVQKELIIF